MTLPDAPETSALWLRFPDAPESLMHAMARMERQRNHIRRTAKTLARELPAEILVSPEAVELVKYLD